ncbi:MAG: SsrA-binding protein SmpB [Acidobacteria bacterium]|nr:SsrA-binding protein SmpB [Acidobacteriota bacterium]
MGAGEKTVVSNRRARKDYEILDTYEAGLVLLGTEVKALRAGNANLKDAYAALDTNELWLRNLYIGPYPPAGPNNQHDPERVRKLLLQRRQIDRLIGRVIEKGLTLVPLRIYFKKGRAKLELAVGRGRKQHDKRDIKRREAADREIEQALRRRR